MSLIHCGDGATWLHDYRGQVDLILTSPPYDDLRRYGGKKFDFDCMADACTAALAPGGVIVWIVNDATHNGSETGSSFRQALGFMSRELKLHDTMIWHKCANRALKHPRHANAFEFMFIFSRGNPRTINIIQDVALPQRADQRQKTQSFRSTAKQDGNKLVYRHRQGRANAPFTGRSNVWYHCPRPKHPCNTGSKHPAVLPMALAMDHIRTWTVPGDLVVDPMCGSGTTVRAAIDMGRRGAGAEIHAPYAAMARAAMGQQTLWPA